MIFTNPRSMLPLACCLQNLINSCEWVIRFWLSSNKPMICIETFSSTPSSGSRGKGATRVWLWCLCLKKRHLFYTVIAKTDKICIKREKVTFEKNGRVGYFNNRSPELNTRPDPIPDSKLSQIWRSSMVVYQCYIAMCVILIQWVLSCENFN